MKDSTKNDEGKERDLVELVCNVETVKPHGQYFFHDLQRIGIH